MREHKFRAWFKGAEVLSDPYNVEEWEKPKMYYDVQRLYDGNIPGLGFIGSFGSLLNNESFVVMEGTGFFDINGPDPNRKLWEGDVLKYQAGEQIRYGVISWSIYTGQWVVVFKSFGMRLFKQIKDYGAKFAGTVYENPDLVPWWEGKI